MKMILKDSERELDAMIETLDPNQDEEVALGIESVRKRYRILKQIREPTANEPEKEVEHGDEEDNSRGENENYLDNSDVESLHEDVSEDGTVELRRTPDYEFVRNASSRVRVKCIDEHCKWMVYAANELHDGKEYFLVKTLHEKHTCSKMFKISHIKAPWIAEEFEAMIYAHPGIKSTYIQDTIKAQLEIEVTKNQCKRAKAIVVKRLERDVLQEYKKLNDYAKALVQTNPESSVDIQVEPIGNGLSPYFKRMYVCLAAVRKGFLNGCRKYLGLDGCFLKGVVKGMLLTAVGKDPNNQMYPLAWAIVETESESSWSWFLEHLKADIMTPDGKEWAFMSDKQKGLLNAVSSIFPQAEHRLCARHIYANWYSDFRGEKLKVAFYSVAKCANEAQMQQRLDEIDNIKDGAKRSLENKDIKQWCRAFFKSASKCDSVDNNSTEAWNFVLIGARSKPIISMNESIREYLMERRIQKVKFASKWRLDCGPNIRDIMNENSSVSCKWKVKWNGDEGFQVYFGRTQHCVHTRDKTCSCGAWELSGIPCCHAIAAIKSRAKDPYDYVDKCYSKEKYLAAYGHPIEVVGSEEFWPHSRGGELLPPLPKAMPGRPKKARRRRKYEPKKSKTKLSRHGRDMHCGNCKSSTHTKRTCTVSLDSADNTT
ncbi:elongation factor G, III-V domain-containing protein [Tanacetum coccineum]